jgi:uncharacterized protein YicC (UPF0701 family)
MSSRPLYQPQTLDASQAPLVARIDALRDKEDAAYDMLYGCLHTQIAGMSAEIAQLETRLNQLTGRPKALIKARLEGLQARRDRAYEKLQTTLQAQIESINAEIRQLERQAAPPIDGDIRASLAERLEALKARCNSAG